MFERPGAWTHEFGTCTLIEDTSNAGAADQPIGGQKERGKRTVVKAISGFPRRSAWVFDSTASVPRQFAQLWDPAGGFFTPLCASVRFAKSRRHLQSVNLGEKFVRLLQCSQQGDDPPMQNDKAADVSGRPEVVPISGVLSFHKNNTFKP